MSIIIYILIVVVSLILSFVAKGLIGKVVKTFSKVGVWTKVLTTPKVMVACLATIAIMIYTTIPF